MSICAFTAVCEEDRVWIPQYLREVERLGVYFAVHFDRCSYATKDMAGHRLCAGYTVQDLPNVEFNEMHKQAVLDLVVTRGFRWALAWDIDETWERHAPEKLSTSTFQHPDAGIVPYDEIVVNWVNLWGDPQHVRVDRPSAGSRVKLLNLHSGRWLFDHPITNGPKLQRARCVVTGEVDLTCLHHGMMTPELRALHKARWDRIYSTALRGDENPYQFWKYMTDDAITPVIKENTWL